MKKFRIFATTIMFLFVLVLAFPCFAVFGKAQAEYDYEYDTEILSEIYSFVDPNNNSSLRHNRISGTEGEENAAQYIKQRLGYFGLTAVNNQSTEDGEQKFFVQTDEGLRLSENIIFKKQGLVGGKKIVIATHYDSMFYTDEDGNIYGGQGVSASGAAVGQVLTLAKVISTSTLNYDIEFVFFGSHFNNLAGSKYYTSFIDENEAQNILLMINVDRVVGSDNILLYTGEIPYSQKDVVVEGFNCGAVAIDASDLSFLADTTKRSVTGLPYTNIALESDNAYFIRSNVKTLNVLSLKDEDIGTLDIVTEKDVVKVQNDTIDYIIERSEGKLATNLSNITNGILALLDVDDIENKLATPGNASAYLFFGNDKLIVFVVAILFIVICFGAYILKIYYKNVSEKAKHDSSLQKVLSSIDINKYDNFNDAMDDIMKQIEKIEEQKTDKGKDKKDNSENTKNKDDDK